jgi:hypothetical protein
MKLYVFADESGVFDRVHADLFVYGGVIILGKTNYDAIVNKHRSLERRLRREDPSLKNVPEIKAAYLNLKQRKRLFNLQVPQCVRFGIVIDQQRVYKQIYQTKQDKQRFLDYALKRGIKHAIESANTSGLILKKEINCMSIVVDEHSTATSGKYTFKETVDEEFRRGTYSPNYDKFFPPLFSLDFPCIPVSYCDSKKVVGVRIADITANWIYKAYSDYPNDQRFLQKLLKSTSVLHLP